MQDSDLKKFLVRKLGMLRKTLFSQNANIDGLSRASNTPIGPRVEEARKYSVTGFRSIVGGGSTNCANARVRQLMQPGREEKYPHDGVLSARPLPQQGPCEAKTGTWPPVVIDAWNQ